MKAPLGIMVVGLALLPLPAKGQTPAAIPTVVIQSQETRWRDVFCDLTEVSRPNPGELMVRVRYRNTGKQPMRFPDLTEAMGLTRAIDAKGRIVYEPITDSEKKLVASSTLTDINSGRSIAPGASQLHWVKLAAPSDAVTSISIAAPGAVVFDDVTIGAKPADKPRTTEKPAIATQESEAEGTSIEVVEARRTAAGVVTIVFRYRNAGTQPLRFPGLSNQIEKAYVIHPGGNTKYPVITTKDRDALSGTTLSLGATSGTTVRPGETLTTWAKFDAPPESAKEITFVVPGAAPFEKLPLGGSFAGAGGGDAIAGRTIGLDAALKDLGARVTDTEIRIDLAADVLFDFDKADIKSEAEPSLQQVAAVVAANVGAAVRIDGHTDAKGADPYNQGLSERRAAAVKAWLVQHGQAQAPLIATRGFGRTKPIAENTKPDGSDNPDGRAKNRRVEILVAKIKQKN